MKTKRQELDEVRQELKSITEPLVNRERELRKELEDESIALQKELFKNTMEGKLFYSESTSLPYSGLKCQITLLKPIACYDFSMYNSCDVLSLKIGFGNDEKVFSFSITKDTQRVDGFGTHYQLLTQEVFDKIKTLADAEIFLAFKNFNIGEM